MKHTILVVSLAITMLSMPGFARIGHEPLLKNLEPGIHFVPGQLFIKFDPGLSIDACSGALDEYRAGVLKTFPQIGWVLVQVMEDQPRTIEKLIARMQTDERIQGACPNYYLRLNWNPNDWYWVNDHLWNLRIIGMESAWDLDSTPPLHGGDPNVVVAVIDSGCAYKTWTDTEHYGEPVEFAQAPDFENIHIWTNPDETPGNGIDDDGNDYIDDYEGWNFVFDSPFPSDDDSHGTHVSGTILQSTNNDGSGTENMRSTVGMAFESRLMILKTAARPDGTSNMDDVVAAILYAADKGADVINMSLGSGYVGQGAGPEVQKEACAYAVEHGVFVAASSGNDGDVGGWDPVFYGVGYPSGFESVVSVGASNNAAVTGDPMSETVTNFSQYGQMIEVIAPSGQYDSPDYDSSGTTDQIYQNIIKVRSFPDMTQFAIRGWVGTSMACPHVSGQAALLVAYARANGWEFTPADIRNRINATAVDINQASFPGYDYHAGFGRINVPASMTAELDPELTVRRATVFEGSGQGNGNFRPEAGETVSLNVDMIALFAPATAISATITSLSSYVSIVNGSASYPSTQTNAISQPVSPFTINLAANTPLQHDAEFEITVVCAESASVTHRFHTRVTPARLLFWDDDRYQGKTTSLDQPVRDALATAGIPFEVWNTTPKVDPDATEQFSYPWEPLVNLSFPTFDDLKQYDAVLWFTGQTGQGKKDLLNYVIPPMIQYLDAGGNLMITAHELMYRLHQPPANTDDLVWINPAADPGNPDQLADYFIYNYLRIAGVEHDDYYQEVMGGTADPFTIGTHQALDINTYNKKLDFDWWPDNLVPREDAVVSFTSGNPVRPGDDYPDMQEAFDDDQPFKAANNPCGIRYPGAGQSSPYRTAYLAFPLESMENPGAVIQTLIPWLLDGTGQTSDRILVDVDTSLSMYTYNELTTPPAGDPFSVYGMVFNPSAPVELQRWVILDVLGQYWFWPGYTPDVTFQTRTVPQGFSSENFLAFEWPQGDFGTFTGIRFWFAHLRTDAAVLEGDYDFCEWGFF